MAGLDCLRDKRFYNVHHHQPASSASGDEDGTSSNNNSAFLFSSFWRLSSSYYYYYYYILLTLNVAKIFIVLVYHFLCTYRLKWEKKWYSRRQMKKNNTKLKAGKKNNTIHYFLPWVQLPSAIAFNQLAAKPMLQLTSHALQDPLPFPWRKLIWFLVQISLGAQFQRSPWLLWHVQGKCSCTLCESDQEVHKMRL